MVELPRLRLPLPERTGSDRDELRCPHGFVDRAYSVFLLRLRCVALLRTLLTCYCDLCASIPPCVLATAPELRRSCDWEPRSERGYEPPGASAPCTSRLLLRKPRAVEGPECRAPMEVPTCARRFRTLEPPLPQRGLEPPGSRRTSRRRDPYLAWTHCSVRASRCVLGAERGLGAPPPRSARTYGVRAAACEGGVENVGRDGVTPCR